MICVNLRIFNKTKEHPVQRTHYYFIELIWLYPIFPTLLGYRYYSKNIFLYILLYHVDSISKQCILYKTAKLTYDYFYWEYNEWQRKSSSYSHISDLLLRSFYLFESLKTFDRTFNRIKMQYHNFRNGKDIDRNISLKASCENL